MSAFYGPDLAAIHDEGYTSFVLKAAPNVIAILRKNGIRRGRIVDLGCGSGQWAETLAEAGYEPWGIDVSAAMIRLARRRLPAATFVRDSFLEASVPECEAVTAIGEPINYLDRRESFLRVFRRVFEALPAGGLFIFDVYEPASSGGGLVQGSHVRIEDDWAVFVTTREEPARNTLVREITSFRKTGAAYRRTEETHRLRLYRGADVAHWLRSVGFRVRMYRGYGAFRLPPRRLALVARKSTDPSTPPRPAASRPRGTRATLRLRSRRGSPCRPGRPD